MGQLHDNRLDEFYERYREYLENQNTLSSAKARSISFDLWLRNNGNALATDIDVIVRFPSSIPWLAKSGSKEAQPLETRLGPPHPPEKPNLLAVGGIVQRHWLSPLQMPEIPIAFRDEWAPVASVVKGNDETFEVHARLAKLKHGHSVCLGRFLAVFSSSDNLKPFEAPFTISAPQVTERIGGVLPVIVRSNPKSNDVEPADRAASQ